MSDFLTRLRRRAGRMAPVLGLLLLSAWFIGASHQHADSAVHARCAACTVAHAPALSASDATEAVRPASCVERLNAAPADAPRTWTRTLASPRAPPQG